MDEENKLAQSDEYKRRAREVQKALGLTPPEPESQVIGSDSLYGPDKLSSEEAEQKYLQLKNAMIQRDRAAQEAQAAQEGRLTEEQEAKLRALQQLRDEQRGYNNRQMQPMNLPIVKPYMIGQ